MHLWLNFYRARLNVATNQEPECIIYIPHTDCPLNDQDAL